MANRNPFPNTIVVATEPLLDRHHLVKVIFPRGNVVRYGTYFEREHAEAIADTMRGIVARQANPSAEEVERAWNDAREIQRQRDVHGTTGMVNIPQLDSQR